mgnify:CR=1 FL=1|jgi:uncharacterized membrane protein
MSASQSDRPMLNIQKITKDHPWAWLNAGWNDFARRPAIGLIYGLTFTVVSYALAACLNYLDMLYLLLPLGAAFTLAGPMLAVGLYEASRRFEANEPVRLGDILTVGARAPSQLAIIGLLLLIALLVWLRIATLLFVLFFSDAIPNLAELLPTLLMTANGLTFLTVGTFIGAVLAFTVFAISAVSVPLLLDRDIDAITAIVISVQAVWGNLGPMLLWAWLIALMTFVGIVTLFFGLIVTFPVIGYATWHAYRDLIEP